MILIMKELINAKKQLTNYFKGKNGYINQLNVRKKYLSSNLETNLFQGEVDTNKKNKDKVTEKLEKNSIYYEIVGKTQKDSLNLDKEFDIKLSDLNELNTFWFKDYFEEN